MTFIDVTEQRQSEVRFKIFARAVPVIAWTTDAKGSVEFFNSKWFEFTGLTEAESLGTEWGKFIHPEDVNSVVKIWRHSMKTGETYRAEYRLKTSKGDYRWVEANGVPFRDINGDIAQWFGTCIDIEDQKTEVDLLRESGEALRTIIDTIPQIIWRSSPNGSMDYISERFLILVSKIPDEVLEMKWLELVHADDRASVLKQWKKMRERSVRIFD